VVHVPVEKFSISLPEELVCEVDEIAHEEGSSRSAVIREATADYVAARRSADFAAKRRERIDRAIDGFRDMARRWGPDERSALSYLDELRGALEIESREGEDDDACP
jgi:predicted transcriptional regulator